MRKSVAGVSDFKQDSVATCGLSRETKVIDSLSGSRETKGDSERSSDGRALSPLSLALEWVARITAVAFLMVLPGFAGQWLDLRWGTTYVTLVGFGLGFCVGFAVLLAMLAKGSAPPRGR